MKTRWKCTVCGKLTVGRLPKGGDGSFYFPARHKAEDDEAACPGNYQQAELVEFEGGARATGGDGERAKPRDFFSEPPTPPVSAVKAAEPPDITAFRRVIGQWEVVCPYCGRRHWEKRLGLAVGKCGLGSYRVVDVTGNHGPCQKTLKKQP